MDGLIYYDGKPYCKGCGAEMTSVLQAKKAICFGGNDCALCGRKFKPKTETDLVKAYSAKEGFFRSVEDNDAGHD